MGPGICTKDSEHLKVSICLLVSAEVKRSCDGVVFGDQAVTMAFSPPDMHVMR